MKLASKLAIGLTTVFGFVMQAAVFAQEEAAPAGTPGFYDIVFGGNAMDLAVWAMIFLTSLATIALIVDAILSIRVAAVKF